MTPEIPKFVSILEQVKVLDIWSDPHRLVNRTEFKLNNSKFWFCVRHTSHIDKITSWFDYDDPDFDNFANMDGHTRDFEYVLDHIEDEELKIKLLYHINLLS